MKHETISDLMRISKIAGLLEGLAAMEGAPINKKAALLMEEAAADLDTLANDVYTKEGTFDEEILLYAEPNQ